MRVLVNKSARNILLIKEKYDSMCLYESIARQETASSNNIPASKCTIYIWT